MILLHILGQITNTGSWLCVVQIGRVPPPSRARLGTSLQTVAPPVGTSLQTVAPLVGTSPTIEKEKSDVPSLAREGGGARRI